MGSNIQTFIGREAEESSKREVLPVITYKINYRVGFLYTISFIVVIVLLLIFSNLYLKMKELRQLEEVERLSNENKKIDLINADKLSEEDRMLLETVRLKRDLLEQEIIRNRLIMIAEKQNDVRATVAFRYPSIDDKKREIEMKLDHIDNSAILNNGPVINRFEIPYVSNPMKETDEILAEKIAVLEASKV